jgi:dipeptidyl aminopeptidase/acylaminoacyl peptidase
MDGGDAQRITDAKEGVQQFAWRPDGNAIAYAALDETPEKKGLNKFNDLFEVGDSDFLEQAAPIPAHLWEVDADGKNAVRLTSGTWTLPVSFPPGPPSSPISWTPDGKSIVIVKQPDPHTGQGDFTSIQVLDVATKALRPLTKQLRLEAYPSVSPDGRSVAYLYPKSGDWLQNNEIFISPISGGEGHSISAGIDRCPYRAQWMPDGKSLILAGNDTTQVAYWRQPVDGPATRLDFGRVCPAHGYWPQYSIAKDGTLAFLASEPDRPTELYLAHPNEKARRLTDFNHEIDGRPVGEREVIEWKSDRFKFNGVLTKPPKFDSSKKYPLVLMIHGGPNSASVMNFGLIPQVFAAKGFLVFEPNYRGSDNLGNEIYKAIQHDAGDGPGRDVMAGLAAVKKLPYVDSDNVAVTGWSYGGYMTAWLSGHYKGWKCAVAGAPVTDFVDSYNLSDGSVAWRMWFKGSPYVGDAIKEYRENSPITYAANVKTPTLIMCDVGDFRVPISQSYAYYHALKDNGTVVKFAAVPVDGHFPGDRARSKLVFGRWLDWVDGYLNGKK